MVGANGRFIAYCDASEGFKSCVLEGCIEGNKVRRAGAHNSLPDEDPVQTHEWELSVQEVVEQQGGQRAERLLHSAIAAGAAITALATAGCAVLVGSCTVGTTVTFGGIAIPCAALIGLCAGGVFAGGASAYELALAYWGN